MDTAVLCVSESADLLLYCVCSIPGFIAPITNKSKVGFVMASAFAVRCGICFRAFLESLALIELTNRAFVIPC